jgi:microcystin-dependent protein
MSSPYLSEIRIMPFNFAPRGWALCNGQLMAIQQNTALFALLGTNYGGDGVRTFGLPNLQGRVPIHFGSNYTLGQLGGEANHTLSVNEMPLHRHYMNAVAATGAGDTPPGSTTYLAEGQSTYTDSPPVDIYGTGGANRTFDPSALALAGGSQPHPNEQPYLVLNFCIALTGIFPSQH